MKLFNSIIFILCFIIISCKNSSKEATNKQHNDSIPSENKNAKKGKDLEYYEDLKIDVLGLNIGETMPQKINGYMLIKSVKILEGEEEPIIKVFENGIEILQLSFAYDSLNEKFTNKIGEILIFTDKFRTNKGIGVNSTIEDFIAAYSKYFIWHTYISNNFVIQTEKPGIQFLLDEKYYIGKKNLFETDKVELKKEDFEKESKIKAIRMY